MIEESRALMQECFFLSHQKYGTDFCSLSDEAQNQIVDEAIQRIMIK